MASRAVVALCYIVAASLLLMALVYLCSEPGTNLASAPLRDPYLTERERLLRETAHIHPQAGSKVDKAERGVHGHHVAHGHHRGNNSLLHHHHHHHHHNTAAAALANKTIHGALIHTIRDKAANAIQKKYFESLVPFPLASWPYTKATSCPGRNGRPPWLTNEEKSLATSHMQVWLEFNFFDHDVLKARERGAYSNGPYYSSWYSSHSGNYTLAADGSLHKHGLPYLDTDVMVMIEDSAKIALVDGKVSTAIMAAVAEIESADIDIVFLGTCEADRLKKDKKTASSGGGVSSVEVCSNAYAVTRRGARALVANYDPCGRSLDELFESLMQRGLLAHKVGSVLSPGENLYRQGFPPPANHRYYVFYTLK